MKLGRKVAFDEMKWLIPLMVCGSLVGIKALLVIPAKPMMYALGVFVIGYALLIRFHSATTRRDQPQVDRAFGFFGGIFSGMFGSGGFVYAMYLTRRLFDRDAIRATQAALIGFSSFTRVVIFRHRRHLCRSAYADVGHRLSCRRCF